MAGASPRLPATIYEVRERGGALLQRLRGAGIWQYNRWFVEHRPEWANDADVQRRITRILNSRGTLAEAQLLKECEELVFAHLVNVDGQTAHVA
jgi:hypothetical protein